MKRFFSFLFIIAILCLAIAMVSCTDPDPAPVQEEVKEEPEEIVIENPESEDHHEHKWSSERTVVYPTCISGGYYAYECTECGYEWHDTFAERNENNHKFPAYVTTQSATCSLEKIQESTCTLCGYHDVKVGSTVGHDFSNLIKSVSSTCAVKGYDKYQCKWCSETYTKTYSTVAHQYTVHVEHKDYTCTEDGYELYKCKWCESTNKNTIYTAHHDMSAWNVDVPNLNAFGECVIGSESRYCTAEGCDHYEEREIAPHTIVVVDVIAPTCAEKGYTVYKCKHCEFTYFVSYVSETPKEKATWL